MRGWDMMSNTHMFDMTGHPALSLPAAALSYEKAAGVKWELSDYALLGQARTLLATEVPDVIEKSLRHALHRNRSAPFGRRHS